VVDQDLETGPVVRAAFVIVQRRTAYPMAPPDLFRSRIVLSALVIGFAFMVGYYGLPFVMSLYLQQQAGLSALQTGLVFMPMMVVGLLVTPLGSRLVERFGARTVVVTGLGLMTTGLTGIALAPVTTPVWVLALLMVLVGLAGPTVIPPTIALLLHAVPMHRAGMASGVFNTTRQLGGALAIAVFGAFLNAPPGIHTGLRLSLLTAATITLAAGFSAIAGLRRTTS
jgi:MFS transporter, DHA2 family, methylenomycin A resistance protein